MTDHLVAKFEEIVEKPIIEVVALNGKTHSIFKVSTADGQLLTIKLFTHREIYSDVDIPEFEKLIWINNELENYKVPHQKILKLVGSSNLFPDGYVINEYVFGDEAKTLIESGKMTEATYFEKLGFLFNNIHKIHLPWFGSLKKENLRSSLYFKNKLSQVMQGIKNVQGAANFSHGEIERINSFFEKAIYLETKCNPVLVHSDAWPSNSVVTPKEEIILIDWDEAKSSIWIEDLANITYTNVPIPFYDERLQKKITSFLKSYEHNNFSPTELENILRILHISNAVNLLNYNFYHTKNQNELELIKEKIESLLTW